MARAGQVGEPGLEQERLGSQDSWVLLDLQGEGNKVSGEVDEDTLDALANHRVTKDIS